MLTEHNLATRHMDTIHANRAEEAVFGATTKKQTEDSPASI